MRIDIRPAELSDVEGMSRVVDDAWRTSYTDIFSPEQIAAYTGEYRRRSFTELIESGRDVYVLLIDGEATAVCAAQTRAEAHYDGYAEIMLLYVAPEWQHKGMGRKLLSHTLRKMRGKGCKGAVLTTAEKNPSARRFYERFGFTVRSKPVKDKSDDGSKVTYTIEF